MTPRSNNVGVGCVALFGFVFAAAGSFALTTGIRGTAQAQQNAWVGVVVGGIFLAVGLGIIVLAFVGRRHVNEQDRRKAAHPNEPWLWREDWARREIKSTSRTVLIGAWVFATFWNAISIPTAFFAMREVAKKPAALIALVFPLIGLGLLVWAIRETLRWRRYGESLFQLGTLPGALGGKLAGTVHAKIHWCSATSVRTRLACVERVRRGKNTSERLLWEDEHRLQPASLTGDSIPVSFDIPQDGEPTSDVGFSARVRWRLEVSAEVRGTDYHAQFEVPVFRTTQGAASAPATLPPQRTERLSAPDLPKGISLNNVGSGVELRFRAARHLVGNLLATVFTLIFTAVAVALFYSKAPLIFPILFGAFSLLMWLAVLNGWTSASRLLVNSTGIDLTKWWCGVPRRRMLARGEIHTIQASLGMTSGNVTFYDIVAVLAGHKQVKLATAIRGKPEAEWLAVQVQAALGK
jgi:hypothetical protein